MLGRDTVPSLPTVSGTPPDQKVSSGRKRGWCLRSSLGKPSSREGPRVGGVWGPRRSAITSPAG